jgi:hypothetical protein
MSQDNDVPQPTPVVKIEPESSAPVMPMAEAESDVQAAEVGGTDVPQAAVEIDEYIVEPPVVATAEAQASATDEALSAVIANVTADAAVAETKPAAASGETEDDQEFVWPAPAELSNATTDVEYFTPLSDKELNQVEPIIPLPPDTAARTLNYLEQAPHLREDTEDNEIFEAAARAGLNTGSYHDSHLAAVQRPDAKFRQQLRYGDRVLGISQPRYAEEGPLLTGQRAVRHVSALLGIGGEVHVPLYHSGFWITFRAPGELEMLNTFDKINSRKIDMGNATHGLVFSNQSAYAASPIMDLAMDCVIDSSVEGMSSGSNALRGLIQTLDLHSVAWGLAVAHNPRGFRFERALISADGKTKNKVVEARINISRALRVDDGMFNDWQRGHMAKRTSGSMKLDQLQIYRDHFANMQAKHIKLSDKVSVVLRVPTVDEYIYSGTAWVDGLIASVASAFTEETSLKERNRMVTERAKATSMRQYAHWVSELQVDRGEGKEPQRMTALEDIIGTLTSVSKKDEIRNLFYREVQKYINDATVSVIAIPQVHPDEAVAVKPRYENLIPIDPLSVFSNLLYQITEINRMRP